MLTLCHIRSNTSDVKSLLREMECRIKLPCDTLRKPEMKISRHSLLKPLIESDVELSSHSLCETAIKSDVELSSHSLCETAIKSDVELSSHSLCETAIKSDVDFAQYNYCITETKLNESTRTKLVTGMREALKSLETQDFSPTSVYQKIDYAEDVLIAFYEAGVSGVILTQEEQLEFAPLIQQALPAIGCRVSYTVLNFPPTNLESSKIDRSGLQFIFDFFQERSKSYSKNDEDGSSIIQDLNDFKEVEDIDEWDYLLKNYVIDEFDPGVDLSMYSNMPHHHWWFF